MKLNYSHKSGVTLIELIIVVVIIGVLSTLAITKFTQGNYSNQARIARLNDYAAKIAASARQARDQDNLTNLVIWRHANGKWGGFTTNGMRGYMAAIDPSVTLTKATATTPNVTWGDANSNGAYDGAGPHGNRWYFKDFDEYLVLHDPEAADLIPETADLETHLVFDVYGESIAVSAAYLAANFTIVVPEE